MSCWTTISRLRVEPFIFLFMFAYALEGLTIAQLAQDKICAHRYGMDDQYCANLSEQPASDVKNLILTEVTTFTLYKTLINTIPVIFWSLFLGAWADKHQRAPKFLMSIVSVASCLESILLYANAYYFESDENFLLLSFVPFSLCGGLLGIMMSVYSYIAGTIEPQYRTIRFAILEALIFVSSPLGIFIGGALIGGIIQGSNGQLHDYQSVFVVGLVAQILATIWIISVTFERRIHRSIKSIKTRDTFAGPVETQDIERLIDNNKSNNNDCSVCEREPLLKGCVKACDHIKTVEEVLSISASSVMSGEPVRPVDSRLLRACNSLAQSSGQVLVVDGQLDNGVDDDNDSHLDTPDAHWYEIFKDLFDIQNVRDMWLTCTRRRLGQKRRQIWILIISLTTMSMTNMGSLQVMFQFVQRVFLWNSQIFSSVNASTLLVTSVSVAVVVPLLIKVCKFNDSSLSLLGCVSMMFQNLLRGSILTEWAFYMSYVVGSLSYVPMISVRSTLSTCVDGHEENKVFGLLSTLEVMAPFLASLLYSALFNATIGSVPGFVFQFSSMVLFIPLIGFIYIAIKFK